MRLTTGDRILSVPEHNARAIERVVIPSSVHTIGSYAFYNCYSLRALTVHSGVRAVGHGALMNCTAFQTIDLYTEEGEKTCLSDLLGQTSGEIAVDLHQKYAEARLIFPPFNEELEDLNCAREDYPGGISGIGPEEIDLIIEPFCRYINRKISAT